MAKNSTGSLDTNVLLRLILGDVPKQAAAVEKLLAKGQSYEIADVIIVEIIFVLEKVYEMPRAQVSENILGIIRNQSFNCNRKVFELALPTYRDTPSVSIVDCLTVAYASINKALPVYTFDKALVKSAPEETVLLS